MIEGVFRDGLPRYMLTLQTPAGPLHVEFVVDTGFDGGLTLPDRRARLLGDAPAAFRNRMLADGSIIRCPVYEITLDSAEGDRNLAVLGIGGKPLLGTVNGPQPGFETAS